MQSNIFLSNEKPLYEQIYDKLVAQILAGEYSTEDRLPSEKELSNLYNVSRITSKNALEKLALDGLIVRKRGKGSFVIENNDFATKESVYSSSNQKKLLVGLVISTFNDAFGSGIIQSIEDQIKKYGGLMILKQTLESSTSEQEAIRELIDYGVDALIVLPVHGEYFSSEILELVVKKFPLVLIDRNLKGVPAISISTNNNKAAEELTDYLFRQGHKEIGFISSSPQNATTIEERMKGFISAYEKRGIIPNRNLWLSSINIHGPLATPVHEQIQRIKEHLENLPNMTATFCVDYNTALLVEEAAKQLGKKVPEDLEVVCFDSVNNQFDPNIRFPFIRQNEQEIGETAVAKLMEIIDGKMMPQQILIDGELVGME